jgi:hypothetical protein
MSVRNVARKLGLALFATVLVVTAAVSEAPGQRKAPGPETASTVEIILKADSVLVAVGEPGTWLSLELTNILQQVGGCEVLLQLDRTDLFRFSGDSVVETTIVCIDTVDCDPADTVIDTVAATTVDTARTVISGWEFVQGRALTNGILEVSAIANQSGMSVPPIPVGGSPDTLLRVYLEKVASDTLLDTLTERTTRVFIVEGETSFSTPDGTRIGRLDSTICHDPPACDSVDTVFYDDSTAFIYIDGVRTFSDACMTGDVNESGFISAADIVYMVVFVFKSGPPPLCSPTQGDVNCNGATSASDIIYLVQHVFKGGPPPLC